jgi:hypothetical protein
LPHRIPKHNGAKEQRGIVTHVKVVRVVIVVGAFFSGESGSSSTASSDGSTLLRGGELVLGRLAVESVGELVDCDCASGGVDAEPVEWV